MLDPGNEKLSNKSSFLRAVNNLNEKQYLNYLEICLANNSHSANVGPAEAPFFSIYFC